MNMTSEWLRDYELRQRVKNGTTQAVPENAVTVEKDLHYDIIEECKRRGWIYFHGSLAHKAMRTVGEPDFTILADKGRVFFVEAKTRQGKLSTEQLGLKMWAGKLGHQIQTVYSMEEFLSLLSSTKSHTPNFLGPTSLQTPNGPSPSTPSDAGCSRD